MHVKSLLDQYKPHGLWYFMPVSSGYGVHGIPDFIVCFGGQFIAIECKSPKGNLTALQEMQLTQLAFAGALTFVINGTDNLDILEVHLNMLLTRVAHETYEATTYK
jgi:Holliday junction resolvase